MRFSKAAAINALVKVLECRESAGALACGLADPALDAALELAA